MVHSIDVAHGGTPDTAYPVTFANEITIENNGPAGLTVFPADGSVSFDITVTDPCYDVVINDPFLNTMSV